MVRRQDKNRANGKATQARSKKQTADKIRDELMDKYGVTVNDRVREWSAAPGEGANAARIAPASHWIEGEEGE